MRITQMILHDPDVLTTLTHFDSRLQLLQKIHFPGQYQEKTLQSRKDAQKLLSLTRTILTETRAKHPLWGLSA